MSPLRVEISGEEEIILSEDESLMTTGLSLRLYGFRNEVVVPHIMDINFIANSLVQIRPFNAVSNQIFLKSGGMELEYDDKKIGIWAVDNPEIKIR